MVRSFPPLLALLASGCVQFSYNIVDRNGPLAEGVASELVPGSTLSLCLATLGAPNALLVDDDRGTFRAIYAWERASGWNLSVSSNSDSVPGSFTMTSRDTGVEGLVLWFDQNRVLVRHERGNLAPAEANTDWLPAGAR